MTWIWGGHCVVGHLGKDHFLRFKQFFEKTGILFNLRINAAVHFIQYTLFTSGFWMGQEEETESKTELLNFNKRYKNHLRSRLVKRNSCRTSSSSSLSSPSFVIVIIFTSPATESGQEPEHRPNRSNTRQRTSGSSCPEDL